MPALTATEPRPVQMWTRKRAKCCDRRTRGFRRWAALRAGFEAELGRVPTIGEATLLDGLADVSLAAETLRARLTAGEAHPEDVTRAAGEARRLRRALGLDGIGAAETEAERQRREAEDREAGLIR